MKQRTLVLVLLALACPAAQAASPTPASPELVIRSTTVNAHPWTAEVEDNICGIANLKRVSKPAAVDYEQLLGETPQIRELERKDIDPDSVQGRALRKAARTLITKSCEKARKAEGYCSVWKAISHEDGRTIPDITEDVLEHF